MAKSGFEHAVGHERKDGENDGGLGDGDAGQAKSIDDEPAIGKPGDFCTDEATGKGEQAEVVFVGLDQDVARGSEADDKTEDGHKKRVGAGKKHGGGSGAKKNGDERLKLGGKLGRARLENNEPKGVANSQDSVDGKPGGAGAIGDKDKADAHDEIHQRGKQVGDKIARANCKNAPFGKKHQEQAKDPAASDDCDNNRANAQQNVEHDMQDGTNDVATFPN